MEQDFWLAVQSAQLGRTEQDTLLCNRMTEAYGLTLTAAQGRALAERRVEALRRTDRVEFGEGILRKLVLAFRDSPYLAPRDYADTLAELQDIFYHFKNESGQRLSDDELIELMKDCFDGTAQGSTEYMAGTALELLCKGLRGAPQEEAEVWERHPDEEEEDAW